MNVIIIAACIPTLRPLFLIIFRRASASDFLNDSCRRQSSYPKEAFSSEPKTTTAISRGSKAFDKYPITRELTRTSQDSQKSLHGINKLERTSQNSIRVSQTICVETREMPSSSGSEAEEWGCRGRAQAQVPLSEIGKPSPPRSRERAATVTAEHHAEEVKGEDMV